MTDLPKVLLVLALAAAGVVLFVRATQGGGPLYYFASAVCLGMAFAAFQGRGGAGRRSDGRRGASTGSGRSTRGGRGR